MAPSKQVKNLGILIDSMPAKFTASLFILEHLERYSRDFNIRLIGVEEEEGEDCMTIVLDHFTLLGFEEAHGELENAHRTGRRQVGKPRHIIAKLYARPFKRNLLRAAKNPQNKNLLNGVRLVEDFTPGDF